MSFYYFCSCDLRWSFDSNCTFPPFSTHKNIVFLLRCVLVMLVLRYLSWQMYLYFNHQANLTCCAEVWQRWKWYKRNRLTICKQNLSCLTYGTGHERDQGITSHHFLTLCQIYHFSHMCYIVINLAIFSVSEELYIIGHIKIYDCQ